MKKVGIVLAVLSAIFWAGCGDSGVVQKITYMNFDTNGNPQVYTLSADGKTSTKLNITLPQSAFYITPSPDASKVAYCLDSTDSLGNTQTAIYVMDMTGKETKLTSGANYGDCIPSFSLDGRKIVFESYRDDPNYVQIYIMNADGTNQQRILTDAADDVYPQLSPDGKSVVFFRYNSSVGSAKPAVSFRQQLQQSRISRGGLHTQTALRPAITFTTGDGLYTIGVDGSNPKQVLDFNTDYAYSAVFTNDNKQLIITTDQFAGDMEVAIVNLDGTGMKNLSNSPNTLDVAPLVIGNQILFNRDDSGGYLDIWEMNMDGSNQKNLTNTPDTDEYLSGYFEMLT